MTIAFLSPEKMQLVHLVILDAVSAVSFLLHKEKELVFVIIVRQPVASFPHFDRPFP